MNSGRFHSEYRTEIGFNIMVLAFKQLQNDQYKNNPLIISIPYSSGAGYFKDQNALFRVKFYNFKFLTFQTPKVCQLAG